MMIFNVLVAGLFLLLWIYVQRRNRATQSSLQSLRQELATTQLDLKKADHRFQQLLGLLTALQDHKASRKESIAWDELANFTVKSIGPLAGAECVVWLQWDPISSEYHG